MADFNSSLPVRTENNGDVAAFLVDGITPSQKASVDANGAQRDVSDGPVSPGTAASFSALIGGQFNTALPTLTNTQQSAIQVDNHGRILVTDSNFPTTVDTNYGVVGANTIRTAAEIGNATGSADFNFGVVGAQTLRIASQIGNATGAADFNFGTVGAQTLRTAAQIGNATGAADFNNGATGAQTLRVAANLAVGGANVTATNPVPVTIEDAPGSHVNDYKDASTIAAAASDNHDYTVTALKTLHFNQVEASASGKAKMVVQVETGVATGIFTTYFTRFNSTSDATFEPLVIQNDILVAAGVRVRVVMTNLDKGSQDLYSTICGYEV
jgi:hypothetical protein